LRGRALELWDVNRAKWLLDIAAIAVDIATIGAATPEELALIGASDATVDAVGISQSLAAISYLGQVARLAEQTQPQAQDKPKQPQTPLGRSPAVYCNPAFIAASQAAWQATQKGTDPNHPEAGFKVQSPNGTDIATTAVQAPQAPTTGSPEMKFTLEKNDLAIVHSHPLGDTIVNGAGGWSQRPSAPADTAETIPQDGTQPVSIYTATSTGLYVSDPTAKDKYKMVRGYPAWLGPCPTKKPH